MKKFKILLLLAVLSSLALVWNSCKKNYDTPPIKTIPTGSVITLGQLRSMFTGTPVHFDQDQSVYAVVTADETSGNLYKNVFIQDSTGAINMRLLNTGGLYQGDSIRINIKGAVLSSYQGMLQLDSVDVDNNVIKQATGVYVAPKVVTIDQINGSLQGYLIQLDSVEFLSGDLGSTYSDPIGQTNVNHTLEDCSGNTVIVRTSGYANFAGEMLPEGRGNFVAVVSQFSTTMQLFIRNLNDVNLNGPRCSGSQASCDPASSVSNDFNDAVQNQTYSHNCWDNIATQGSRFWDGKVFTNSNTGQTDIYVQATAHGSSDPVTEAWLISPPVIAHSGVTLSFETAQAYPSGEALTVLISRDYSGDPTTATWNSITCTLANSSNSNYEWVPSGNIDLTGYLPQGYTGPIWIGFKYSGSSTVTTNYDIDNFNLQ